MKSDASMKLMLPSSINDLKHKECKDKTFISFFLMSSQLFLIVRIITACLWNLTEKCCDQT